MIEPEYSNKQAIQINIYKIKNMQTHPNKQANKFLHPYQAKCTQNIN